MSSESPVVIDVCHVGKQYHIYARPADRLRQFWRSLWYRLSGHALKPCWRAFNALDDVSLQIRKGETVGIIGRNGSGKSTLLQIICGTLTPTSGTVGVQGRVAALLELGSGFNPEFTGRENVFLNASVLGLSNEQTAERFDAIAAFADIGDFMEQPVKTYSSGMALRLAFAVIAHVDADVLVVDEALAVGDSFFTQKCMRFLRNFMKNGTVLFVSHDIEAVKALCGRVIWLDRSRLMRDGETAAVCQDYLDALFAHQQGASLLDGASAAPAPAAPPRPTVFRDPRQDFINASNLRNDIEVVQFDPHSPAFGTGHATITGARLLDEDEHPLSWVIGGEIVHLDIEAQVSVHMPMPVIGFIVKDRMGQSLFGDNTGLTYCSRPMPAAPGEVLRARFTFRMPRLPAGEYSTAIAIASGFQGDYVHHHWLHDALCFRSQSLTTAASGLVGIPMHDIRLSVAPPGDSP